MSEPPLWQKAVVGAQSRATPVLRAAVDRQEVTAGIGLLQTLRGVVVRSTEAPSRRLLHLFNLPAGSDINRMLVQIASLERELRELRKRIEDEQRDGTLKEPYT
jgi:hypothetical protein